MFGCTPTCTYTSSFSTTISVQKPSDQVFGYISNFTSTGTRWFGSHITEIARVDHTLTALRTWDKIHVVQRKPASGGYLTDYKSVYVIEQLSSGVFKLRTLKSYTCWNGKCKTITPRTYIGSWTFNVQQSGHGCTIKCTVEIVSRTCCYKLTNLLDYTLKQSYKKEVSNIMQNMYVILTTS